MKSFCKTLIITTAVLLPNITLAELNDETSKLYCTKMSEKVGENNRKLMLEICNEGEMKSRNFISSRSFDKDIIKYCTNTDLVQKFGSYEVNETCIKEQKFHKDRILTMPINSKADKECMEKEKSNGFVEIEDCMVSEEARRICKPLEVKTENALSDLVINVRCHGDKRDIINKNRGGSYNQNSLLKN